MHAPHESTGAQGRRPPPPKRAGGGHSPLLDLQSLAGNRAVASALSEDPKREPSPRPLQLLSVQRFIFLGHSRMRPSGAVVTSPGCAVTWNGTNVRLSGLLQTYGPLSTPTLAGQVKAAIEKEWTGGPFDDGSKISATASVEHRDASTSADGNKSQIYVTSTNSPSNVHHAYYNPFGQYTMDLNLAPGHGDVNWTPAHEFGHMVGLPDHYSEGIVSKVKGKFGGERETTIDKGWADNIMAEDHGTVDKRNVAEFLDKYAKEFVIGGDDDTVASNDQGLDQEEDGAATA